jgi:hypothetical protein
VERRLSGYPVFLLALALAACGGGGGGGGGSTGPADFSIGSGPGSASLEWAPANDPRVAGYRIYVGTTSGNYAQNFDARGATTGVVSGLTSGQRYYFAVTAYDNAGGQSGFSNEASKLSN